MSETTKATAVSFNDARIRSDTVRGFFDIWDKLRAGRPAPARSDFLPEQFARWWPNMFLVDLVFDAGEPSFTYRLVGTGLEDRLGKSLGGRSADSVMGGDDGAPWSGSLDRAYRTCFDSMSPVHHFMKFKTDNGAPGTFERILLPLSADGQKVDQMLGLAIYENLQTNRAY
jgi:hypothetical protein